LDVAFIMVEAMEPGKKFEGTEPEGWVEYLNRLNAYMSASPSARYAILTSGTNTKIYRRDLEYPRALQEIGDLPKYESARSAAEHSPFKVSLNPSEPDGIQTGLQPLTRDKFREVLGDIEPPLVTNQALARIRIREAVDSLPDFLQAFLSSPAGQIQIIALKRPVAQGNLSLTETGQILVPMIPLDQQEKVISRMQAYRSEAKRLRNEAEAIVIAAKARVERMILGEEVGDG
jgi:hypothetical protein